MISSWFFATICAGMKGLEGSLLSVLTVLSPDNGFQLHFKRCKPLKLHVEQ
jgi:hypothetical protein